jgi:hypothetical protein
MELQRRIAIMMTRLVRVGTLAAFSVAAVAPRSVLPAQGTQAVQEQVQLAFGYECEDRFLVRNDGTQPVTVEYGITGVEQRSSLLLNGKESTELSSAADSPVELWVNGKLVATEQKGNRPCANGQAGAVGYDQAGPIVVVRPIAEVDYVGYGQPGYYAPRMVSVGGYAQYGYGYGSPSVIVTPLFRSYGGYGGGYGGAYSGYGGYGGYSRDGRVIQAGPVGPVYRGGTGRPVPNHVEPRRPVQQVQQYSTGGRERQGQASGGWERQNRQQASGGRERQTQTWQRPAPQRPAPQQSSGGRQRPSAPQQPSGGHVRQGQQQASGGHGQKSQGDRGHSHHRQG